jgi:hypothetical protein
MYSFKIVVLLLTFTVLQGCVSSAPDPARSILGSWESSLGGFTLVSTFSETEVILDGHKGLPYLLEDNRLTIDGDQTSTRLVDFPGTDEMVQIDPVTNTEHRYTRKES